MADHGHGGGGHGGGDHKKDHHAPAKASGGGHGGGGLSLFGGVQVVVGAVALIMITAFFVHHAGLFTGIILVLICAVFLIPEAVVTTIMFVARKYLVLTEVDNPIGRRTAQIGAPLLAVTMVIVNVPTCLCLAVFTVCWKYSIITFPEKNGETVLRWTREYPSSWHVACLTLAFLVLIWALLETSWDVCSSIFRWFESRAPGHHHDAHPKTGGHVAHH
jgi:hypothetical protein